MNDKENQPSAYYVEPFTVNKMLDEIDSRAKAICARLYRVDKPTNREKSDDLRNLQFRIIDELSDLALEFISMLPSSDLKDGDAGKIVNMVMRYIPEEFASDESFRMREKVWQSVTEKLVRRIYPEQSNVVNDIADRTSKLAEEAANKPDSNKPTGV